MTVMQFDSRRGWFNPDKPFNGNPARIALSRAVNRAIAEGAPVYVNMPDPKTAPIETRDFFVLLDQARAGDAAAREELRTRGNKTTR